MSGNNNDYRGKEFLYLDIITSKKQELLIACFCQ